MFGNRKEKSMKIQEILNEAICKLKEENIGEPVLKARLLLCYILNVEKEYLIINNNKEITKEQEEEYNNAIQKLTSGYPIQYITNHQEFMKLNFYVDENVLIPRADTEITVLEVISYCKDMENVKILDLCTGSGAIAITLKKYIPNCEVIAVDISNKALDVAKKNEQKNNLQNIQWLQSNLFEKVSGKFDVIVSNPPYIKKDVIKTLDKQVQAEPLIALDGGDDGLTFYRKIITKAPSYLNENGAIFLEIGFDQKEDVTKIIENTNKYTKITCKKDFAGNDRMIMAQIKKG
jgi:release factor glutamine methyltransferase